MKENKTLVQEALIQMKQVEDVIAENAKGILASTMKEEINQLVKESLSEQETEDDEVEFDVEAKVTKKYEGFTHEWRITSVSESKIDEVIQ